MPWTQSDVDTLRATISRIANGAKSVSYGDRQVTNHDLPELLKLLGAMEIDVAGASSSGTGGSRSTYASFTSE